MDIKVVYNEKLDRATCATLLTETIKYLLFHRFQIPLPLDQLKAEDERERKEETGGNSSRNQASRPIPSSVKKKRQTIADIEQLLLHLFRLFLQVDVLDVLLLFGATVVNPKEIYSVRFHNVRKATEADRLKAITLTGKENGLASRSKFVDKCCRKLARTLFTDPNLNDCGELKCTSINCFVLAPRDTKMEWFKPRSSFKMPVKGKCFFVNVSECGMTTETDEVEQAVPTDTMWFQAPVVAKGYKETYHETSNSSIWGK